MSTVLLVDDEHDIRQVVESLLADDGYTVVACADGQAALDYLSQQRPDLVLMDVMMPLVDGLEVLRQIRTMPRLDGLKVVLMSALPPRQKESWDAFLAKPFSARRLGQVVHQLCPPPT